ncbi:helix-turn-helix domain-containing protein [Nonomuraea sp. NBC_01738]|uniref:PucR family transcriptional regulator n=1 Tax=Nonomuraea sp. NBC_01738 TaxID=2976003 RepID=UPI002E0DC3AA|nr:helix-turn-helix domain-containing protein [Nonomuraea sp. NBC_01738]
MPSIVDEVLIAISDAIPELAHRTTGAHGQLLKRGVERILSSFIQRVADPNASFEARDAVCRQLGRFEAREGRSLDSLQAAYRLGLRLVWRRSVEVGNRHGIDPALVATMGDSIIAFIGELAEQSVRGHREEQARANRDLHERRARLLRHILDGGGAVSERAARAAWTPPEEITLVLMRPGEPPAERGVDADILADWEGAEPCLLIPGPLDRDRLNRLSPALADRPAVVSVTVPLADAPSAMRWARRVLTLADEGVIDADPLLRCEDHLVTLWLLADQELTNQIARREFVALGSFTDVRRERLLETLGVWLATRGTAADIGHRLNVHPQTVRYRMRQLESALGDALAEPDRRFAIDLVLRARSVRQAYPVS